jgi:hypothetical protein
MYATVRNYSSNAGLADALVEHEGEVRSIVDGIDGFKAYYLIKTADGAASISVLDDEAGASESTRAAAQSVGENLPQLAGSPPQVTSGDVVISF